MSEACWVGTVIGLGVARATVVQSMAISSVITCHAVLNAQGLRFYNSVPSSAVKEMGR